MWLLFAVLSPVMVVSFPGCPLDPREARDWASSGTGASVDRGQVLLNVVAPAAVSCIVAQRAQPLVKL